MRKIKSFFGITAWLVAMMLLALACSDDLDVRASYLFDLETMPVQKRIKQDETAEIRCQLVKEGNYRDAKFFIRYFQPDGVGELHMDDGTVFKPNDLYPLDKETFRLYYMSRCTDQQTIDVYVQDNMGQVIQKTFTFQNDNPQEENEEKSSASLMEYMKPIFTMQQTLLATGTLLP